MSKTPKTPLLSFGRYVNLSSDDDDKSISSQRPRKRVKLMNTFRPAEREENSTPVTTCVLETKIHDALAAGTEVRNVVDYAGSSIKVASVAARTESTIDLTKICSNIFSGNVTRPSSGTLLPKPGARINTTL
ncbi:hypothetical protein BGX24_006417 [Mortierella sp. AD032]|nr:hypothetical protein BGX24_006417 [Mortierella sp. AD032]